MADEQGMDISMVAESGKRLNLLTAKVCHLEGFMYEAIGLGDTFVFYLFFCFINHSIHIMCNCVVCVKSFQRGGGFV